MITLFELWEEFIGTANTHQGGHVKPNRNFVKWCNTISKEIYNDLVQEFEKSRVISDKLTPFLRSANVTVVNLRGQMFDEVKYPKEYNYFAGMRVLRKKEDSCACNDYELIDGSTGNVMDKADCRILVIDTDELEKAQAAEDENLCEVAVEKIPHARWSSVCTHRTLKPSFQKPKCTQYENGFKIAPKNLGVVILDFFRKPKEATFLYTLLHPNEENEYIQYDAVNSDALEWDDKMKPEFISRLITKYGIFNREQLLYSVGKEESKD